MPEIPAIRPLNNINPPLAKPISAPPKAALIHNDHV
jgi:hypothetical protein